MPPPPEPPTTPLSELAPKDIATRIENGDAIHLVDCRNHEERTITTIEGSIHVPLQELPSHLELLYEYEEETLVVFCHHGIRSRQAADMLREAGFGNIHSMSGGIDRWSIEVDDSVGRY